MNLDESYPLAATFPKSSTSSSKSRAADPIKYEVDKETGALFVDRFIDTAMHYPCNYGYIPHTLADDGDPVDVLVITPFPVQPGVVVRCRPLGVLKMKDEAGGDAKLLAVPIDKVLPIVRAHPEARRRGAERSAADPALLRALQGPRAGKWVKVIGWDGPRRRDARKSSSRSWRRCDAAQAGVLSVAAATRRRTGHADRRDRLSGRGLAVRRRPQRLALVQLVDVALIIVASRSRNRSTASANEGCASQCAEQVGSRQEAARHLVFALRAAFEDLDAEVDRRTRSAGSSGLEVQVGHVLNGTPVAAVEPAGVAYQQARGDRHACRRRGSSARVGHRAPIPGKNARFR